MWLIRRKKGKKPVCQQYLKHKSVARQIILRKLNIWAPTCEVEYKRVAIRNTRRSWGSCSSLGNLNFNYKLIFLPDCLIDYIIVHELCHLKELNHSQKFWNHVETVLPNYKNQVEELRKMEKNLGTSLPALMRFNQNHFCLDCQRTKTETISLHQKNKCDILLAKLW